MKPLMTAREALMDVESVVIDAEGAVLALCDIDAGAAPGGYIWATDRLCEHIAQIRERLDAAFLAVHAAKLATEARV